MSVDDVPGKLLAGCIETEKNTFLSKGLQPDLQPSVKGLPCKCYIKVP